MRVVVVGGGIIGVSAAWQLTRAGADAVLITEGELVSQASGRSLAWLNSAGVRSEAYHLLRMASIDRYRTLAAQHPEATWLRFDGGLRWRSAPEAAGLYREHEHEVAHGYDSHWMTPEQVARQFRGVDPSAVPETGAVWNPGEGWIDLPSLARLLTTRLTQRGGSAVTAAGRVTLDTAGGRVVGVRSEHGQQYAADAVLLAAGHGVPGIVAELGVRVPDATVPALLITTEPIRHPLRVVLNTPRVAVRPAPGGALAVDADWASTRVTVRADGTHQVPDDVVRSLLAEASAVLSGQPDLAARRCGIGPKPIPGDGEPVLGGVDAIPGLYLAFTHSGATLAPIVGEYLAYEILHERPHPMLIPFNVRRFG